MKTITPKNFLFYFLSGTFISLFFVGVINRVIDPFWYYRDIEIKGLNTIKPVFRRYERYVKPALLIRDQPEAIILGSSFSEIGFDPTNQYFTNNSLLKSMNFALAGAPWDMVQCSFEFAANHAQIKRALIGIHPGDLPVADCEKVFSKFSEVSPLELLLSTRALDASKETIFGQKTKKISHTKEGMYFYIRGKNKTDSRFKILLPKNTSEEGQCNTQNSIKKNPEKMDLSGLDKLINIAKKNNIELTLFAYPSHAYNLELNNQCNKMESKWDFLREIVKLTENEPNGLIKVWHFYGYNDITTEPINSLPAKYWQDPEHFNFEVGNIMLEEMFGNKRDPSKLGQHINMSNFESERQSFFNGREFYLSNHPEFRKKINALTQN